ncbi:unnamed protein product [Rotaria socialis]|uniref:YEATS domain-containing protein n=1 Tax=Rotaria socialis TaxID=392032 RepID=A0A818P0A3_9BILA|nr:unnamed protein product [Rotaria socialis]CAF4625310.1 unnamed protein product [Rotaria socialis]
MSTITSESRIPVTIVKPIVYGNTAQHFGSKRDSDGHTHKWKLYVRSFNNDDMTKYINRIQFRLHETYPNNVRVLNQPPYEIEESGWGEFETQITIFFADPCEKPVVFYFHLKLFSTEPDIVVGRKPLVNEYYDELVFQEPSDLLARAINSTQLLPISTEENRAIEQEYAKRKIYTVTRIKRARERVRHEIQDLTERLRLTQQSIKHVRQRSITLISPTNDNIIRD